MQNITIEYSTDGGKTIARLITDGKPGFWHVSKEGVLDELHDKVQKKTISHYSFYELMIKILGNSDLPLAHEDDEDTDFLISLFKDQRLGRAIEAMVTNPFSPKASLRAVPKEFWNDPKQKEWFFSGPDFRSETFSNAKRANEVLAEISMKKEVTDEEKLRLWGLLETNIEIPKQKNKGMVN